jgi:ketosteroid isomerase-like protein
MSQENMELMQRVLSAWNRGERDFGWAFHRDVVFLPIRTATEGAYLGIAGTERFAADTEEMFDKFEMHCELLEVGEQIIIWGTVHVRARQSGIETDIPMGGAIEFRDGKIVRWEDVGSKTKALEAVGLAE